MRLSKSLFKSTKNLQINNSSAVEDTEEDQNDYYDDDNSKDNIMN